MPADRVSRTLARIDVHLFDSAPTRPTVSIRLTISGAGTQIALARVIGRITPLPLIKRYLGLNFPLSYFPGQVTNGENPLTSCLTSGVHFNQFLSPP